MMLPSGVLLLGLSLATSQVTCANSSDYAPLYGMDHPGRVADMYMVALAPNCTIDQHWANIGHNLSYLPDFIHHDHLFGYAATIANASHLDAIRKDPNVSFLEANRLQQVIEVPDFSKSSRVNASSSLSGSKRQKILRYDTVTDVWAPWHLRVVGGRGKLRTPVDNWEGAYEYISQAGRGVDIYIFDSGIDIYNKYFGIRATNLDGRDQDELSPYTWPRETWADSNGHGTHVAGLAGADGYGVAPGAEIVNVKVIDKTGNSYYYGVVAAVNRVCGNHRLNKGTLGKWDFRGSVINMSFGDYGFAPYLHRALDYARSYGITTVASAGNHARDAYWLWPCNFDSVVCVAAMDRNYTKTWWSNYGWVVNMVAPGENLYSLDWKNEDQVVQESGTSMSAPLVAGTVAIFTSWLALTDGGADKLFEVNSLVNVCEGFNADTNNNLVNTGIRYPGKNPAEPCVYCGPDPAENPPPRSVVPLTNVTGIPNYLTQTTDRLTLTTKGVTSTHSSITGQDAVTGSGSIMSISVISGPSTGTETPVSQSILSELGLSNLGRKSNATMPSTKTSPPATTTTTATECWGNQIQGPCVQAGLPSATPDSGPLQPVCNKVDSSSEKTILFNATQAANGVSTYCQSLISERTVLTSFNSAPRPGFVAGGAQNGGYISISVLFDVDSCSPGTSAADQQVDFGSMTLDDCFQNLYTNIEVSCSKTAGWQNFNPDYSMEGGLYGYKCAVWAMSGLPGSPPSK